MILETKRLKQTLKDVEERHKEFVQIEKKIEEIRDLMGELASMVYDVEKRNNLSFVFSKFVLFLARW